MVGRSRRHGIMQQFCSFCSRNQDEVNRLIAGPNSIYICDECVDLCQDILEEEQRPKGHVHPWARRLLPPKEIYRRLNQYVIGQEQAKKVLSVAVYNHYKRIAMGKFTNDDVELQKSNILLLGPTGCGKTLLAQTLARILDVPFCITDATVLTEAGYVGEDVETILRQLIQASDGDVKRAERGIIYIDEIDKVARKSGANPSITRDVSGEGVQQALLKLMEGSVANVPPQGGRKHPHQEYIKIDTTNVLFICGGAFDDLEKIVLDRIESKVSLGFRPGLAQKPTQINNALSHVMADDLMKYGLIPEFIGRLPVLVAVNAMDEETLTRILVEPKNALLKQYKKLFKMDNVDLRFTQEAISVAARQALTLKTGARGLRTVIESTLLDIMYEIPSQSHIGCVEITGEVIAGLKKPLLYDRTEKAVSQPVIQEKAA